MGKSAPPPPDFNAAANAQADASQAATNQQTLANRPGQTNAFGSQVQWAQNPDGTWTQNQSFGGPMGAAAQGLQQQAAQSMATPFSFGQFGDVTTGDTARNQAITAAYNQASARLTPQFEGRENALRAQLANQGLDPNSQAARSAMGELGAQRNDAFQGAMNSAIAQGTAAGDSVFRNNMMARQQAISEALRQRGMPMQELLGLSGLLAQPGFMGAGAAQAPQLLQAAGLQNGADMAAWQGTNQAWADMLGGVGQLAGAGALFALSDESAKRDIQRLDVEAVPGVPFARWRYKPEFDSSGAWWVGVIAQDMERAGYGRYVATRPDGQKAVNYAFLHEVKHHG